VNTQLEPNDGGIQHPALELARVLAVGENRLIYWLVFFDNDARSPAITRLVM
jgi:hypothetical protein